jgi:hypothetical protein
MRKLLIPLTAVLIMLVFALAAMEVVLRLVPSLMSVAVIERMHPDLRTAIAAQLKLPVAEDHIVIASEERSDKGPNLYITKPDRDYFRPADPIDHDFGAIDMFHSDIRGFCNPLDLAKQATFDVVTVAGSVPNCAAISSDDVFSADLGRLIGAGSYSLAVARLGPYEYNEVLARFGRDLKPRVVVFAVSEANDLRDCERYLDHVAGKGKDKRAKIGGPFRYSYALAFIKAGIGVVAKQVRSAAEPDFRYTVKTGDGEVAMNVRNVDVDELQSAFEIADGKLTPDLYAPPLTRFVELSREMGFVPLVVYVPAAYTVYRQGIAYLDPKIAPVLDSQSDVQRKWLADNAVKIGYRFVDPTVDMQHKAATSPAFYFPANLHLTAAGHKALAEAVAADVRSALAAP